MDSYVHHRAMLLTASYDLYLFLTSSSLCSFSTNVTLVIESLIKFEILRGEKRRNVLPLKFVTRQKLFIKFRGGISPVYYQEE